MIVKDINFYKKYRYLIKEINNIFEYIELDKIKHIVRFRDLPIEDKCFII